MNILNKAAAKAAQIAGVSPLDAVRSAEALVDKIEGAMAQQTAAVATLEAELQALALAVANDELPPGDKSALAKLAELDGAKTAFRLAEAALPGARQKVADAQHAARLAHRAEHLKVVKKFALKRSKAAEEMTAAIEALAKSWRAFHAANKDLALWWWPDGGRLPAASLTGPDFVVQAVSAEIARLGATDHVFAGGRTDLTPSLPGSDMSARWIAQQGKRPLLSDAVDAANAALVNAIEHGAAKHEPVPLSAFSTPGEMTIKPVDAPVDASTDNSIDLTGARPEDIGGPVTFTAPRKVRME